MRRARPLGGGHPLWSRALTLYDFEVECREQGWEDPALVYDGEKDLFRWTDGRFAYSRKAWPHTHLTRRSPRFFKPSDPVSA